MTLYTFVGIWLWALWLYVLIMGARAALLRGELTLFWKIHLFPLLPVGLALDVAFNLTFGFMFADLPHELLFSSRVERHYRRSDGWRRDLAVFWARNLNVFDSTHITRRGQL